MFQCRNVHKTQGGMATCSLSLSLLFSQFLLPRSLACLRALALCIAVAAAGGVCVCAFVCLCVCRASRKINEKYLEKLPKKMFVLFICARLYIPYQHLPLFCINFMHFWFLRNWNLTQFMWKLVGQLIALLLLFSHSHTHTLMHTKKTHTANEKTQQETLTKAID